MSDDPGNCLPLCPTACFSGETTSQSASIIASLSGDAILPRRTIRLTGDVDQQLQSTAKTRGYANASAFLRAAINHELRGREDTMIGAEERLATSMDQMRREIFRLGRAQQALFAFVDSLAKVLLTCVPEPGGEAMEAAVTRARGRHARLLKIAGQAMVGDSHLAMQELVNHGEG